MKITLTKIRNSLRLRKRQPVQATRPFVSADAPTTELSAVERIELPRIAGRMVRIASNPAAPNQRRRALFYEQEFYSQF